MYITTIVLCCGLTKLLWAGFGAVSPIFGSWNVLPTSIYPYRTPGFVMVIIFLGTTIIKRVFIYKRKSTSGSICTSANSCTIIWLYFNKKNTLFFTLIPIYFITTFVSVINCKPLELMETTSVVNGIIMHRRTNFFIYNIYLCI